MVKMLRYLFCVLGHGHPDGYPTAPPDVFEGHGRMWAICTRCDQFIWSRRSWYLGEDRQVQDKNGLIPAHPSGSPRQEKD